MRRPPAVRHLPLLLLALTVLAACGTSGRALREPNRNAVAPTRTTAAPTTSSAPQTSMQLVAEGFGPNETLPAANACGGQPPALRWWGIPPGTSEVGLALVDVDEPDELKRILWMVAGVPVSGVEDTLPAGGALPPGAVALTKGGGGAGYTGPCITGGTPHSLNFLVFALPTSAGLTADSSPVEAYTLFERVAGINVAYYPTFSG